MLKIKSVDRHRNGVHGATFDIILFDERDGGLSHKVAIVFDNPNHVAVLDVDLLCAGNIKRGENSWRGDDYEPFLRKELDRREKIALTELDAKIAVMDATELAENEY